MVSNSWLEKLEVLRPYQLIRFSMNRRLVSYLISHVPFSGQKLKVAEQACGSGFAAHLMAQEENVGLSIAGDLNLDDFRQASISGFQADFVLMDIFRPAIEDNSLDLVWNSSSLEELGNPQAALASMAEITKPGGYVFVGVPSRLGLAGLLSLVPHEKTRLWVGKVFSRGELRQLIKSADLVIEDEITYLYGTFIGILARKPIH